MECQDSRQHIAAGIAPQSYDILVCIYTWLRFIRDGENRPIELWQVAADADEVVRQCSSSLKHESRNEQIAGNSVLRPLAIISIKPFHSSIYPVYMVCLR